MARMILLVAFLCVIGGIAFLALSDVPAPTKAIEKPIDTGKFFQK